MKTFFLTLVIVHVVSFIAKSQDGTLLFDDSYVHEVNLQFFEEDFEAQLTNNYSYGHANDVDIEYIMASITIDGTTLDTIGVRYKGDMSYVLGGNKLSLKIDINEFVSGQKYDGLKKFNLHNFAGDPAFMRDKITYDILNERGVISPRAGYARVSFNGIYHGLYCLTEQIDKTFLENRFTDKTGNLFKAKGGATLEYIDDDPTSYENTEYAYELKTNEDINDWSDLANFISVINNTTEEFFIDSLDNNFYYNSFVNYLAVQNFVANWDSYLVGGNNFYLYNDPVNDKFALIPWDNSQAFSNDGVYSSSFSIMHDDMYSMPLNDKILNNSTLKNLYLTTVCELINAECSIENLRAKIDNIADMIRNDVYEDVNKPYSNDDFENNIEYITIDDPILTGTFEYPGLKRFLEDRVSYIQNELDNFGITCNLENAEILNNDEYLIFPNPVNTNSYLTINNSFKNNVKINVYSISGQLIYSSIHNNSNYIYISTQNYNQGVYQIQVIDGDDIVNSIFIVK